MVDITIKYKVVDIVPEEHSFIVRFFTDSITEDMLATEYTSEGDIARRPDGSPTKCRTDYNINIFKTPTPSNEEILAMIELNAPAEWFYMQEQINDPNIDTSMDTLTPLLNKVGTVVKPVIITSPTPEANVDPQSTN